MLVSYTDVVTAHLHSVPLLQGEIGKNTLRYNERRSYENRARGGKKGFLSVKWT